MFGKISNSCVLSSKIHTMETTWELFNRAFITAEAIKHLSKAFKNCPDTIGKICSAFASFSEILI